MYIGHCVCEVIPYKNFKERVKLIKEFLKKGITPKDLGNSLYINYNIKRKEI